MNRKNENILEELSGLKEDEVRVLDTVDMDNNRENQDNYNDPEIENFNDADRDSDNCSEPEEKIDQPTPLNPNKPNHESKGTLDLGNVQDNQPLVNNANGVANNKQDESDRMDYSV